MERNEAVYGVSCFLLPTSFFIRFFFLLLSLILLKSWRKTWTTIVLLFDVVQRQKKKNCKGHDNSFSSGDKKRKLSSKHTFWCFSCDFFSLQHFLDLVLSEMEFQVRVTGGTRVESHDFTGNRKILRVKHKKDQMYSIYSIVSRECNVSFYWNVWPAGKQGFLFVFFLLIQRKKKKRLIRKKWRFSPVTHMTVLCLFLVDVSRK